MKKFVLLLCICFSFTGCSAQNIKNKADTASASDTEASSEEEWLGSISKDIINGLSELTDDDTYISSVASSDEINDIINGCKGTEADISTIHVIKFTEDLAEDFSRSSGFYDYDELTDTGRETFRKALPNTLSMRISSMQGAEHLAASSVINYSVSYISKYDIDDQIWFIPTNKDDIEICITLINTGEGVISVSGRYIFIKDEEEEALKAYLPDVEPEIISFE